MKLNNLTCTSALTRCSVIAAMNVAGIAMAQTGANDPIIVTATRAEATSVQETPIAVSAFSAETLDSAGVLDVGNLAQLTPNFSFSANGPFAVSSIRGIGTNNVFAGGDPSVTVQVDGVYYARVSSGNIDFLDVERVEVLRGPQGTLYGRNAIAGTINVITQDPEGDFAGRARLSVGNYDFYRGEAMVRGPLVPDLLYASLAGQISVRDGYIEQLVPGLDDTWDEDRWSVRGKLKLVPDDRFDFTLAFDYSDQNELYNGDTVRIVQPFADGFDPDHFEVATDFPNALDLERWGISGTAVWDLSDDVSLTSITSYRESDLVTTADLDNSALFLTHSRFFPEYQSQFTQEFLVNAEIGDLTLVGGLYYFSEDVYSAIQGAAPVFSILQRFGIDAQTDSYAAFLQGSYAITDRLTVTAGVRYTRDEKQAVNEVGADFVDPVFGVIPAFPADPTVPPLTTVVGPVVDNNFDALTPNVRLEYEFSPDAFGYLSVTRGFKSGGFNLLTDALNLPTVTPVPYDEETVWAYEAGLKLTLADGLGIFNVTGFYYDYSGLQVNQFFSNGSFGQAIFNAPGAEVYGLELEANANVTDFFTLGANLSYLSSEYDGSFLVPDDPNPVLGTLVDADGNTTNDAPEWSGNIFAEFDGPLSGALDGMLRVDASYKDDVFYTPSNNPLESGDDYWLVHATAAISASDDSWQAGLRVRNLFNERYIDRAVTLVGITSARPGAPRTVVGFVEVRF